MSTFGKALPVSLFGESHGAMIGLTLHDFPGGVKLDISALQEALNKRKAKSYIDTKRHEDDTLEIVSGFSNGITTGEPLTFIVKNTNTKSTDYTPFHLRPSHADYPAYMRFNGNYDYKGGGHFSGRLTAMLVVLGALSKQVLAKRNIKVYSHIHQVHTLKGQSFYDAALKEAQLEALETADYPVISPEDFTRFQTKIHRTQLEGDSLPGITETMITGLQVGYGEPFFDKVEALISHLVMSIPAAKAISFGRGFDLIALKGSEANDPMRIKNDTVITTKNDMGGLTGGLTNGNPVIFKTLFKATPSIAKPQKTVNLKTRENITLTLKGRHDPCLTMRAVHVVTAVSYYAMLELICRKEGKLWIH